jgi:hypothetical protein
MEIRDFKMNTYAYKPIVEEGRFSAYSGNWEINYSGILSRLIQEAGRFCESFASDLFIDWKTVEEEIESMKDGGAVSFLFGFRQMGVDHAAFVLARYENNTHAEHEYRSMWRLDMNADGGKLTMTLGRVF